MKLSDELFFLDGGLRFHLESGDHWFFESTTFPIGYSYRTLNQDRSVMLFSKPNLELGVGYIF